MTCPLFITTAEFLPQHREQHRQTLQIVSAAEARGHARMVEMNQQVADNLQCIITALETGEVEKSDGATDAPDSTPPIVAAAHRRHELTRAKAIQALRELEHTGAPVSFAAVAQTARVSRSWLYTEPDLAAEISRVPNWPARLLIALLRSPRNFLRTSAASGTPGA